MAEAGGLHYEEHGPPDARPLILSAGLGGSGNYWRPNLEALAERHRVILYDHRGTGRSERALPETVTVAQMGEDIRIVMDAAGLPAATIIGHAAGAAAALALALDSPERVSALVLVNGFSRPDPHFVRCFETRLALLRNSGPAAYLHAQPIFLYPANFSSELAEYIALEEVEQLAHFAGADAYEKRIAALLAFDVDDRLGEIRAPTVALCSEDDMLVPSFCSRRLHEGIPGAELAVLRWGGHACNFTNTDSFNRLLLEILEG